MRIKMSKQPPPAPTANVVGPWPTVINIVGRPGTGSLPSTIAHPTTPCILYDVHYQVDSGDSDQPAPFWQLSGPSHTVLLSRHFVSILRTMAIPIPNRVRFWKANYFFCILLRCFVKIIIQYIEYNIMYINYI